MGRHRRESTARVLLSELVGVPSGPRPRTAGPARRLNTTGLAIAFLCTIAAGMSLTASPALAVSSTVSSHVFQAPAIGSGPGSAAGDLENPHSVAVDEATGDIYVADTGNHRVDEFTSSGTFVRAWGWGVNGVPGLGECTELTSCKAGESGSSPGEFESPSFVAVDNAAGPEQGDVYVAEPAAFVAAQPLSV